MIFSNIFGIHEQALLLRSQRAELLASNMANADTPNYKARDIDFRQALAQARDSAETLRVTQRGHLGMSGSGFTAPVQYRNPLQASLDQNTVDTQLEQSAFTQNALQYQASLRFINGRVSGLLAAIRGE